VKENVAEQRASHLVPAEAWGLCQGRRREKTLRGCEAVGMQKKESLPRGRAHGGEDTRKRGTRVGLLQTKRGRDAYDIGEVTLRPGSIDLPKRPEKTATGGAMLSSIVCSGKEKGSSWRKREQTPKAARRKTSSRVRGYKLKKTPETCTQQFRRSKQAKQPHLEQGGKGNRECLSRQPTHAGQKENQDKNPDERSRRGEEKRGKDKTDSLPAAPLIHDARNRVDRKRP